MSAHGKAAEEVLETPEKPIVKKTYLPEKIFHMGENSLFWKECLKGLASYGGHASVRFRGFYEQETVLLGGSVTGYKLKPSVIWPRESPGPSRAAGSVHHQALQQQREVLGTQPPPRCPPELLRRRNGEVLFGGTYFPSLFLLMMLLDICLSLVTFIPRPRGVYAPGSTSLTQPAAFKRHHLRHRCPGCCNPGRR